MDRRILIAVVVGLLLVAFGGFYYAFIARSHDQVIAAMPVTPLAQPARATPASVEAELTRSDQAELVELVRQNFGDDYNALIASAVHLRNEGSTDEALGQLVAARLQQVMRGKLKYAAAADMAVIDRLAGNELALFHALGTSASGFCLKVLGKDSGPDRGPLPPDIQSMMRLGNFYRFQAIVDGMPRFRPVDPLSADEAAALDAALNRVGMKLEDVRSGAFLNQEGAESGKPCVMIEKLYGAIAGLGDETRRKLYAGMFFIDRDK